MPSFWSAVAEVLLLDGWHKVELGTFQLEEVVRVELIPEWLFLGAVVVFRERLGPKVVTVRCRLDEVHAVRLDLA